MAEAFELLLWTVVWVVGLPLVAAVATPIILVAACFQRQPYRRAVLDMYRRFWGYWKQWGIWYFALGIVAAVVLAIAIFGHQPKP